MSAKRVVGDCAQLIRTKQWLVRPGVTVSRVLLETFGEGRYAWELGGLDLADPLRGRL